MSFDLCVFEQSKAPKSYDEFLAWFSEQTDWNEERDYNSIDGTSSALTAWFMDMKATFSPLNGPYCLDDDIVFANKDIENHLTDYSIGSDIIYAAFAWSLADEAAELAESLAKKHAVGFFNPQTGAIESADMIVCVKCNERMDDKPVTWQQIEQDILTLDDPERGAFRNSAFITLAFKNNGSDEQFMQCMPNYCKPDNFFKKLFNASKKSTE